MLKLLIGSMMVMATLLANITGVYTPILLSAGEQCTTIPDYPITVIDDLSRTVQIVSLPKRVVSVAPSATELLFTMGLTKDSLVGIDILSDFPSAVNTIPNRIEIYPTINYEQLLSLNADLVVGAGITSVDCITQLEALNQTVIILAPQTLDGLLNDILLLGTVLNETLEAQNIYNDAEQRINDVKSKVLQLISHPKVYIEYFPDPYWTFGAGSIVDEMITFAGGTNIAKSINSPWCEIDDEFIIGSNPDIILCTKGPYTNTSAEDIASRPGWHAIKAVQTNQIYILDENSVVRPTLRNLDIIEQCFNYIEKLQDVPLTNLHITSLPISIVGWIGVIIVHYHSKKKAKDD